MKPWRIRTCFYCFPLFVCYLIPKTFYSFLFVLFFFSRSQIPPSEAHSNPQHVGEHQTTGSASKGFPETCTHCTDVHVWNVCQKLRSLSYGRSHWGACSYFLIFACEIVTSTVPQRSNSARANRAIICEGLRNVTQMNKVLESCCIWLTVHFTVSV